jgi:hypothetical protein
MLTGMRSAIIAFMGDQTKLHPLFDYVPAILQLCISYGRAMPILFPIHLVFLPCFQQERLPVCRKSAKNNSRFYILIPTAGCCYDHLPSKSRFIPRKKNLGCGVERSMDIAQQN